MTSGIKKIKTDDLYNIFTEREKKTLILRFRNYSLSEIAKNFKVTIERMRQVERKALKKIRKELNDFFEKYKDY